ncbi:hypothetical protein [Gordonia amicalis]|uniref:hypothetical protein n=1 Tax=Gordonia amicalis TaxID=89053 RepID=UPI0002A6519F|nr:hypothetical protein [Gordonia amicalis]MBA5846978.1 hypothetical protein [Gordonia amicalis]MDV7173103.1 hypothetical protein [Gordonia amicalis]NKX79645.1 hypothetical protein [Gordonia amicalis]UOG20125.1 hypothetical protein MTX80_12850 [Gordonia amicalis]GAC55007.1 hypothetical protein GOAMI_41_00420 [Gordonia amicalis NBRC 100051 = JCM 11271]
MIAAAPEVEVHHLATHPLILALPAVIPAFILVGVIIAIAIADRRRGYDDEEPTEDSTGDRTENPTDAPTRNEADDPDREAD